MTNSAKIKELRVRIKELEAMVARYETPGPAFKNFRLEESEAGGTILRYKEGEIDWCILTITNTGEISRYPGIYDSKVFKTDSVGSVFTR